MNAIRRLHGLGRQRRTLAAAVILLGLVPLLLRFGSLGFARKAMARVSRLVPDSARTATGEVHAIVCAFDSAIRRGPFRPACLARALALQFLLERSGIATDLRFGVRRGAAGLEAHAWLEREGAPIGDAEESGSPFLTLQAAAGR